MSESIVPFADLKAKRAHEHAAESNDATGAIEQLLVAMEGMQTQVQALTDLVIEQDARIRALERAGKSKIIKVVP